ncbi:hypothetical protein AURDEDRAFT_125082 [Auricularia subglabra TFB-10046 SS5]|nr:hypothetical protein AURDEDRAFT_125082 [Auricularia subglabra TFB-10046 SS5]
MAQSLQDRQIQHILDNIDGGAPAAALAAVQKLLKKTPGSVLCKTLKAYALAKSGDNTDRLKLANSLIDDVLESRPADEQVLLLADKTLCALGRHPELAQLYEHAYLRNELDFDLGTKAALHYARAGRWSKAHHVAFKMYRKSRGDTHCWWAVCAAVMQVRTAVSAAAVLLTRGDQAGESTTPAAARPVVLRHALRLIELAPLPSWAVPDRFLMHCDVLAALDWDYKALDLLERTAEGQALCTRLPAAEDMRRQLAYQVGHWPEEGERARLLIEDGHYAWDVMTAYVNGALYNVAPPFSPVPSSSSSWGPSSAPSSPRMDDKWPAPPLVNDQQRAKLLRAANEARAFLERIADREDEKHHAALGTQERGPLLALLTLEARVRAYGADMTCLDLVAALKRYIAALAGRGRVCFEDARPFVALLADAEREELRGWVELLPVDLTSRAALRRTTNTLALYRALVPQQDDDALLCAVAFARLWKRAVRVAGSSVELVESSGSEYDTASAPSTLSPVSDSVKTSLSAELDKLQRAEAEAGGTSPKSDSEPAPRVPCITLSAAPRPGPAERVTLSALLRRVALEEVSDEEGGELCRAVRSAPRTPEVLLEHASPRQDGKRKEALPSALARKLRHFIWAMVVLMLDAGKERSGLQKEPGCVAEKGPAPSFFARRDALNTKEKVDSGACCKGRDAPRLTRIPADDGKDGQLSPKPQEDKKPKRTVCPAPKYTDDPMFCAGTERADLVDQRGELHPADDLALLAAQAFVGAWKASGDPKHLLPALCVLEGAARHSPSSPALRLHLVRLYRLLGCGAGPAVDHYEQMKVGVGGESMGHWVLERAGAFAYGVKPGSEGSLGARVADMCARKDERDALAAAADAVVNCFQHEQYMSINAILTLNDRLERSLQSDLNAIEHLRMSLLRAPKPNLEKLQAELAEMQLMLDYEPHDNRDFSVLPNFQPLWSESFVAQTDLGGVGAPGDRWRRAFLKLYLRAFGTGGKDDGEGAALAERVHGTTEAELAQLTAHERGLVAFVDTVKAWVDGGAEEEGAEEFVDAFVDEVVSCEKLLGGEAVLAGEILHAATLLHERYVCYNLLTAHLAGGGGGKKNKKKTAPSVRTARTRLQDGMKRVAAALKACAGRQTEELYAPHCVFVRLPHSRVNMASLCELPTELWLCIWELLPPTGRLAVSQVCHRWRSVALGTRRHWADIEFCATSRYTSCPGAKFDPSAYAVTSNLPLLREVMRRSGTLPLSVTIRAQFGTESIFPALGAALGPHTRRIVALLHRGRAQQFFAILEQLPNLPVLRQLTTIGGMVPQEFMHFAPASIPHSALAHLDLSEKILLPPSPATFPSLRTLSITIPRLSYIERIVEGCPSLRDLRVNLRFMARDECLTTEHPALARLLCIPEVLIVGATQEWAAGLVNLLSALGRMDRPRPCRPLAMLDIGSATGTKRSTLRRNFCIKHGRFTGASPL